MKTRTASRLAWVVFGVAAVSAAGAVVFAGLNARGSDLAGSEEIQDALLMVALFSFSWVC